MPSFFKGLKTFFPQRIWQQIFILLAIFVVLPLIVLGFLLIHTSQKAIKTSILRDHKEIVLHATGELQKSIECARQSLHITAAILGTLHADVWRQETALVELALNSSEFKRIASVDLNGKEIAVSELGSPLMDRSKEDVFQRAKLGTFSTSDIYASDNHLSSLMMAVPIQKMGKTSGVLMGEVDLRDVWGLVDNIHIGRTGFAYLVDQSGRIIAHPDKKLVLKNDLLVFPDVAFDLKNMRAGSKEKKDLTNKNILFSYAPIKSLGWGLILVHPGKEAYAFSNIMIIQSWILIVLSISAAVGLSFMLSRFMSNPLNKMNQTMNQVVRGDFSQTFRIRRRDELGRFLFGFNRMIQQLKNVQQMEKMSVVGKAATAIAHELKNSLVLIKTFIYLLPERHNDRNFIKEFSDTIPKELESWNVMLKNMMDFAKQNQLLITDVNINRLVEDIASFVRLRVKEKKIRFNVKIDNSLPLIYGDKEKLKQVLLNLLTNAIEATPQEGVIVISTTFFNQNSHSLVEVQVANTGVFIPLDQINRIFEPFYTTKMDGLGLGLAISAEIIRSHGGTIDVVNDAQKGVLFTVRIPAKNGLFVKNNEDSEKNVSYKDV